MIHWFETNEELVDYLIHAGSLKTGRIIDAFLRVDRQLFLPEDEKRFAYLNAPLLIGFNQTISQPQTVAFMLELLQASKGARILDVGSGSGWTSALLSIIAGEEGVVVATERIPGLVRFGKTNIKKLDLKNIKIFQAEKMLGKASLSPYDRILVSASSKDKISRELIDQLPASGRLVLPINNSIFEIIKNSNKQIIKKEYPGFTFVPLVDNHE